MNTQFPNDLANKIKDMIKNSPLSDVEKNINALIQGAFTKMELVSRQEFDIQAKVLENTQAKLVELAAKLADLEAQLKQKQP